MNNQAWWEVKKDPHDAVMAYVWEVDRRQSSLYERFLRLEALYDPNSLNSILVGTANRQEQSSITENVIASTVDTATAEIATSTVRARVMTDGGDWSTQRRAKDLEKYAEAIQKLTGLDAKARAAFREAAKKGTGVLKVYADAFGRPRVDHVLVEDIVVDEYEMRSGGEPMQMHQRRCNVDRQSLKAEFPKFRVQIDAAQSGIGSSRNIRSWAGRPIGKGELVTIESWRLPIGCEGEPGYVPGRHTLCIDGCTLLDEEWDKDHFPFAVFRWTKRAAGWFGISLAERIVGHQRAINKRNWQIDRQLDQHAVPTTYVSPVDANLAVKSRSSLGTIAVVKGSPPVTVIPQAVSAETYNHLDRLIASAYETTGISRMAAQSYKPAGLDSGAALREYRDQTTQRFAAQQLDLEQLVLDAVVLLIEVCKDLGTDAPEVWSKTRFGARKIRWADVSIDDVRVQIAAASTLSRTPAGRLQTVAEWLQAQFISAEEAVRLLEHPDTQRAASIFTAGLEDIEYTIEAIENGSIVVPEPYQNLKLGVRRVNAAYLKDCADGAPEEVLDGLRTWLVQAAHILNPPADPMAAAGPQPVPMPDEAALMGAPAGMPAPPPPQALDVLAS